MTSIPEAVLGPLMIAVLLLWVGFMSWSLRDSALTPKTDAARRAAPSSAAPAANAPPRHTSAHDHAVGDERDPASDRAALASQAS